MKSIFGFFLLTTLAVSVSCNSPKVVSASTGMMEITETYWRLTELRSKAIPRPVSPEKKEVYIRLKKNGNLEGFAGCNGFGGHFELKDSSRVIFSNIMGTMMACSDLETENKLLDALRESDNFVHNGNRLILSRPNKSVLARFEADYSK